MIDFQLFAFLFYRKNSKYELKRQTDMADAGK